jgi:uncharacterized protein
VKVDVTLNEVLSFPLEDRPVLRGYPEFADLPENRSILVYSLNEIAAEKTVALTDPAVFMTFGRAKKQKERKPFVTN